MEFIKSKGPGILLCSLIAVIASCLGERWPVVGGPVFGILIGVLFTIFIKDKGCLTEGINFTSKKILQYAVIFLGFGMNFVDILYRGRQSLPIIISTITVALLMAFILSKILKMDSKVATLIGVGSSICGGSAIAATAPVIKAEAEEIAQSISVIFLFNVIAALIFPSLGGYLGLSNEGFGIFAGTAINDTSSVTAAASAWDGIYGSNTLEIATVVKLTRTLAIVPITLFLGIWMSKGESKEHKVKISSIVPSFILFFLGAALITTIFDLNGSVVVYFKEVSKFFIVMAMGAIGTHTDIMKLIKSDIKPVFLGFGCWVAITIISLSMQKILGFW